MKVVMSEAPLHLLEWRARTGADRWDEMWEGVLHMTPAPSSAHQELAAALDRWLWVHWAQPGGNKVYPAINLASIGGWPNDYRIPDLLLLTPERFEIDHNEYFEGPPTVVVEIRSPGDETVEKMPFYARLGVPEMWIIDRDTKVPELYALRQGEYENQPADEEGWLKSAATGVRLRGEGRQKLVVQMADDPTTRRFLPED